MKKFLCILGWVLLLGASARAVTTDDVPLAGDWKLDLAASSSIKPWDSETLRIAVNGTSVDIKRAITWGQERHAADRTTAVTDGTTVTSNPVTYWLDTWYNNVYIGGDHTKKVRASWLDHGRVLKVETSLTLEAQQGDVPVHIYEEYRLSPDGKTLKVFQLRSTRDQPLTFVFTRQ